MNQVIIQMEKLIEEMKTFDGIKDARIKALEKMVEEYEAVIEELKNTIHGLSQ